MTQQQEMWYRYSLARRQSLMAAAARMANIRGPAAAGGSEAGGDGKQEEITVPDIPAPAEGMLKFTDGTLSTMSEYAVWTNAVEEDAVTARMAQMTDVIVGQNDIIDGYVGLDGGGILPISGLTLPDGISGLIICNLPGLTELTVPNTVTNMASIEGCPNLKKLTIGSGLSSVGEGGEDQFFCPLIYDYPEGLEIRISKDNQTFKVQGDFVMSKDGTRLVQYFGNDPAVVVLTGTEIIEAGAFGVCTGLTSVTIPASVTSIRDWAFGDCSSLTSVTIPDGVTSIGHQAFEGCLELSDVKIEGDIESIGERAFLNCKDGITVEMPEKTAENVADMEYYPWGIASGVIRCKDEDLVFERITA